MRYLIKMEVLKEEGIKLQNYAKTVVDSKIQEAIKLRENMGWQGVAASRFDQKYDQMVSGLCELSNIVEKLGSFMEFCSEHYIEANEDVVRKWAETIDEMEKNRKERLNQ